MNFNKVMFAGNLTRDPELRYTPANKAVCNFTIAMNRGKDENKETTYIRIIAWEKTGLMCDQYLEKGSAVFIEGRLQIRKYDKEGVTHSVAEVVANNVQFLSKPKG